MGGMKVPVVQQQFARKVQPKMRELASRHVKLIAKWLHNQFSWKQFLMGWMVVLIASKMVLLALTFPFFTLTSLVSLQVFVASSSCQLYFCQILVNMADQWIIITKNSFEINCNQHR